MMIARIGVIVLLIVMAVVLCGCAPCTEKTQETVSPGGRTIVRVVLDPGCFGGATVGSYTSVYMIRKPAIPFLDRKSVV
jgi:hypothetical protein